MLKVSESGFTGEGAVVKLEGELMGPWVAEAASYCERFLRDGLQLTLDVGEVSFLDREGVLLLKKLLAGQVSLTNCTPFIAELLKTEGSLTAE